MLRRLDIPCRELYLKPQARNQQRNMAYVRIDADAGLQSLFCIEVKPMAEHIIYRWHFSNKEQPWITPPRSKYKIWKVILSP